MRVEDAPGLMLGNCETPRILNYNNVDRNCSILSSHTCCSILCRDNHCPVTISSHTVLWLALWVHWSITVSSQSQ